MADPLGIIGPSGAGPAMPTPLRGASEQHAPQGPSFKDVLMKNIEQVNRLQQDAQTAVEDLTAGRRDDPNAVFAAKQKADIAFQMLLQVRNKLMDAYEEVKQMRV